MARHGAQEAATPPVRIAGDLAEITFDRFDLPAYELFLRIKQLPESRVAFDWRADAYTVTTPARFAARLGVVPEAAVRRGSPELSAHLFDYQRWAVGRALEAKRFALWLDTGLGKTACYLEWARQVQETTNARVLILAPLAVITQVTAEAERFYGSDMAITPLRTRESLIAWCQGAIGITGSPFGITNPEKFIAGEIPELRHLGGLVCDECFASGTPVDTPDGPRPIETIRAGDQVLNATGVDTVVATKRRVVTGFVAVHVDNGTSMINSENHPYLTRRGWVRAGDLRAGDELVSQSEAMRVLRDGVHAQTGADAVLHPELRREMAGATAGSTRDRQSVGHHRHKSVTPLYVVWPGDDPCEFHYAVLQPVVCGDIPDGTAGRAGADRGATAGAATEETEDNPSLRRVWIDLRRHGEEPDAAVLQSELLSELAYAPAGDQGEGPQPGGCGQSRPEGASLAGIGGTGGRGGEAPHCGTESDAESRVTRKGGGDAACDGAPATVARWQGSRDYEASADTLGSVGRGLGLRIRGAGHAEGGRSSDLPLPRHRAAGPEDRGRSGRGVASCADVARAGCAQDGLPQSARVDRVEVLERDDPRLAADRGADGAVQFYDLEVANHPSFSVHGLLVHNSSILKTGGGTIKWNLIKSARGIEYKLSCTATPAPNDAMEYASQAAFLETIRHEGEVLWTYFHKGDKGDWSIKPHARAAFYRFMASWSLYLRDPKQFGFADILASLPDPVTIEERIELTDQQRVAMTAVLAEHRAGLFGDQLGITARTKLAQIARGFLYRGKGSQRTVERIPSRKAVHVADLIRQEADAGRQVLVWTTFDEEGAILHGMIPGRARVLDGRQTDDERQAILAAFRAGEFRCLISKPSLIGYGLNLQFVESMIFSGFDDSFERVYQAIRRAYRFGQTRPVRVFFPYVPELEGMMHENIRQKEQRFLAEVAAQEALYREALAEDLAVPA